MKIAIAGKGGVGKTTFAAALSILLARRGRRVIAVDADADGNLADALGVPPEAAPEPVSALKDLITERTGAKGEGYGGYFKINPYVDDIPEKYCAEKEGVKLLVLGTVEPGKGCLCPESAFLRALMGYLIFRADEDVILDMEAGLEHLGRASAKSVDAMIAVVEPGMRSVKTARDVCRMAQTIGVPKTFVVLNRIQKEEQEKTLRNALQGLNVFGALPCDEKLHECDLAGRPPFEEETNYLRAAEKILEKLEAAMSK